MGRKRGRSASRSGVAEASAVETRPTRWRVVARRWWWALLAVLLAAGLVSLGSAAEEAFDVAGEGDIWQLTMDQLESRIDAQLAAGETATLDWRVLEQLNYRTGERSALLHRLDQRMVRIPGFAVPLEDYTEEFSEFLIVPWAGACIHTPPPPPNQMVYSLMKGERRASAPWWEPVWVEGVLHVIPTMSPYGAVGYQLEGMHVLPLE
jgi:uncharacterized protein